MTTTHPSFPQANSFANPYTDNMTEDVLRKVQGVARSRPIAIFVGCFLTRRRSIDLCIVTTACCSG
ncbi:hypothetical protein FRACA_80051 [Frankia canadensis]|uniref:Uncharacterized protein n=1 Tax=Frankia canadensis TaxID=1836972 RepID=A0A2I2L1F9_9ACTN|nr:hypothetical protein FRACA_80051 [Frankia canadensis]SOU59041.1 hypothetical protein FRACA_80051 [Frankia canadensis]